MTSRMTSLYFNPQRERARVESAQKEAEFAVKRLKEKKDESKSRLAKRKSRISKFLMKGSRGAKYHEIFQCLVRVGGSRNKTMIRRTKGDLRKR
jgi:hypothetical protein